MKKIELTKKGKIVLSIMFVIIIFVVALILFMSNKNELEFLDLNVTPISEDAKWDEDQLSLILNVHSKAQLTYDVYPEDAKVEEISFNNFDRDIINIDSLGVITGLKTGTTELQISSGDTKSYRIKIYVY